MSVPNGTQSSFDHKQLGPTATASYESRRVAYHKYLDGKEGRRNQSRFGGTSCMNACMSGICSFQCFPQVDPSQIMRSILKAPFPSAIAEVVEEFSACWV